MWISSGKRGTCEIITGLGKTFIALHALYTMPRTKEIHLFLAETVGRKDDLEKDILKYNEIFGRDVHKDYNLEFHCYQTVYRWKDREFGLVIADEIHDSLSPAYSRFYFNNRFKSIIGLSATVNKSTTYTLGDKRYTKGDLLKSVAPICFTYNITQGQADKTARKLNIYVIQHQLDKVNKTVKSGSKTKKFMQTEFAAYDYWDKQHKRAWFVDDPEQRDLKIRITSTKRSNILYNLQSKIPVIKKIIDAVKGKTIVFGNSIDSLLQITENVISSRNTDVKNKAIRDAFDSNKIQVIGSFKKLKQGANLVGLDNCVIMSYYSTDKDFIQRIGRLRQNGEIGNVFILLTQSTQEEIWFSKMMDGAGDLNIIYCPTIDYGIKKMKEDGAH